MTNIETAMEALEKIVYTANATDMARIAVEALRQVAQPQTVDWLHNIIEDESVPLNHAVINGKLVCFNAPRWIPVSDRLPEEDGYYICWWPGLQHPAFQCFWDGFTWRNTNAPTVMPVTHWQHLPEAPNE